MKKILTILLCLCALSCNNDNDVQIDNPWADEYPWLEKIMIKAEKGDFKDANGKPAVVLIFVVEVNEEHYFLFNYGRSGGLMYDETRDSKGDVIDELDPEFPPGPFEMIYPVF